MAERKILRHKFLFVIGMAVAFSVLMAFLTLQTAYSNSNPVSIQTTNSSEPQQVNISISKIRDASVDSSVFFKSSNLKPGDKISGFIEVKNDGLLPITYSSYAEKTGGSDRLYEAFLLKVMTEEGQLLYGHEEADDDKEAVGHEEDNEDGGVVITGLPLYTFTGFEPRPLGVSESELLFFEFELPYSFGSKDRSKDWSEYGNESIPLEKRLEYSKRYQNLLTKFRIVFTASGEPDPGGDDGGGDNGGSDDPGDGGGSDDPGDDEPGRDDQPGEDDNDGTDDTPDSDDGTGEDETGSDDDTRSGDETGSDDRSGEDTDQPGSTDKTGSGGSGERLPNTATSLFNLLLIGIVLLVVGGIWYLLQHVKGERQRMLTK